MEGVASLLEKLKDFERCLPSHLKLIPRNLYLQASNAQSIAFVSLLSFWYECHYDLYRFSLDGFRESFDVSSQNPAFAQQCRQFALHWAVTQARFWSSVTERGNMVVVDPSMVALVHSNTRILLACRRMGLGGEDDVIPSLLESTLHS